MTTDPNDQQSESEFEQDVEAVRSAWPGLDKTEPPQLLDQAVLNTARRELEGRRRYRPWRWLGAFSTAAVVVLALTIVVQQDEQSPTQVLKKTDGFMLDQAAPAARINEADRDDAEDKAGPEESAGQIQLETGSRDELRMKQSAAAPAAPTSGAAISAAAENMPRAAAEPEKVGRAISEAEAWIERLLILRETHQDEQLRAGLAAFRKAYPDYPLPPELE